MFRGLGFYGSGALGAWNLGLKMWGEKLQCWGGKVSGFNWGSGLEAGLRVWV